MGRSGAGVVKRFPDLPPVWAFGSAVLATILAWLMPVARVPSWPGVLLLACGLGLVFWSAWWFRHKRTTIVPGELPTALIVEGPYRVNRNPIYTGLVLIVLGYGLILGALSALVPAFLLLWVIDRRFVRPEEAVLEASFGESARHYFRSTRRW